MFKNIILMILGILFFFNIAYCDQYVNVPNRCQFGINALKTFHIPDQLFTTVSTRIGYMHELGVTWDRSDFWWNKIEPKRGSFDFTFPDKAISFYEKNDIQMFPILCYHSNWAKDGTAPATKEEQELFANYVSQCVKRYRGRITYWELWNEPNILPFWKPNPNVADYTALLKKSYIAAKKANPKCQIIGTCMAGYDPEFLERLYQLGGKDYFDVLSYHYYRSIPPEYEVSKELDDLHNLMARYGDGNKRIWVTEMGVSNHPKFGVNDELHAAYLVRNHLLCFACGYVDQVFQFDMINWTDDTSAQWDGMLGLMKVSGERKPSYFAYQNMVKLLDGARIIGRVPIFKENIYAYLFQKNNQNILVYWTVKGEKKFTISDTQNQVTLINLYGKKENKLNQGDSIELTATEFPTYLLAAPDNLITPASFKVYPHDIELTPGEEIETIVELQNPGRQPLSGKLQWTVRPGISITPQVTNMIIPKKNTLKLRFKIKADPTVSETEYPIACRFESAINLYKAVTIKIHPAFRIHAHPLYDTKNNRIKVIVQTTNMLQKPVNGTYRVTLEYGKARILLGETRLEKLNPRQRIDTEFSCDTDRLFQIKQPFTMQIQFSPDESWRTKTIEVPYAIQPQIETPPQIDGNLNEWDKVPSIELDRKQQVLRGIETWSPGKLNATIKLAWTKTDVYFAAEVIDSDPGYNPISSTDLWRGDAFELYLGLAGPEEQRYYSDSDFQIGLSTGTETTKPFIFLWKKDIEITQGEIAIKRMPGKYFLEARIPISALMEFQPKPNTVIGFDVAIDDLNRNESIDYSRPPEGRSLMWRGTNMNWQNPSNWGVAIIK
jgi:hypothetical protein